MILHKCFVEIDKDKTGLDKNVVIGVAYKPPNSDVEEFSNLLVQKIKKVTQEKKLLYIMGDMNINLLNSDTHIPTQHFINNMYASYHISLINKPTRITEYSQHLLTTYTPII